MPRLDHRAAIVTTMQFGYSCDYAYIEEVLQDLYQPFSQLAMDVASFVPRPISDFEPEKRKEIERLAALKPGDSLDSTTAYVNELFAIHTSYWWQLAQRFSSRIEKQYVQVALLSLALCEASINAILAIGLTEQGSHEDFRKLEKCSVTKKWCDAPKKFSPEYDLPKDTAIFETLSFLVQQRNAIVHHKIELKMYGKKVLDGSNFRRLPLIEKLSWMARYFSLPYDLCDRAIFVTKKPFIMGILRNRGPIPIVDAHSSETGPALDIEDGATR